jgi:hypothetical protein
MYKSISSVNKFSPEITTGSWLSALIMINILSILLLFKFPIETIGLNGVYLGISIIMLLNFKCFIYKGKYKSIIKKFDEEKRKTYFDYFIIIYPYLSFFFLFKILEIDNITTFITIGILILIDIIAISSSNSDNG